MLIDEQMCFQLLYISKDINVDYVWNGLKGQKQNF